MHKHWCCRLGPGPNIFRRTVAITRVGTHWGDPFGTPPNHGLLICAVVARTPPRRRHLKRVRNQYINTDGGHIINISHHVWFTDVLFIEDAMRRAHRRPRGSRLDVPSRWLGIVRHVVGYGLCLGRVLGGSWQVLGRFSLERRPGAV